MMKKVFDFLGGYLGRFILFTLIAVMNLVIGARHHSSLLMLSGAVWAWSSGLCFAGYFSGKVIATYKTALDRLSIRNTK